MKKEMIGTWFILVLSVMILATLVMQFAALNHMVIEQCKATGDVYDAVYCSNAIAGLKEFISEPFNWFRYM